MAEEKLAPSATDLEFEWYADNSDPAERATCLRCRTLPASVRLRLWERTVELCETCVMKFAADVRAHETDPFRAVEILIEDLRLAHSPIGGTA